ncbi:MAG TPA: alpha/beta hydrolase [Propionibacteriaceae bacterium]|nr:alpha/beta hydrolase [Propionibacteriaceae bacterium]
MPEAVVIVSGGSAISPFTTPDAVCRSGQQAGSTDSFLRSELLAQGHTVFTAPAHAGPGPAERDSGFAGFDDPAEVLSESLTINSLGSIDEAGARLVRLLCYLEERFGYDQFSIVAHSMGGLFSTAAMNQLSDSPVTVSRLITIGTPWDGGFAADYAAGDLDLSEAQGNPAFEQILTEFANAVHDLPADNAGQQVTAGFLRRWLPTQVAALDQLAVTLIAGEAFTGAGSMWPNDGLVTVPSALAHAVPGSALGAAPRYQFADAHSIYFADMFGLPWERALTWDPAVIATVGQALKA